MTVHKQLLAVQGATEVTIQDKPSDKISQETEDSILLDDLAQLTKSPNHDIRAAVGRIVTKRLFRKSDDDSAWGVLMGDLSGWDLRRRDKALALLRYVLNSSLGMASARSLFAVSGVYQRVVECLRDMLPEARRAEAQSLYHSQPERDALWLLGTMDYDAADEASVDLVGTWLAHYPFGGEDASNVDKPVIIGNIMMGAPVFKDSEFGYSMQSVLVQSHRSQRYRDSMAHHGLFSDLSYETLYNVRGVTPSPPLSHGPEPFVRTSDDWDFTNMSPGPREMDWDFISPSPREIEQSPEEQAIRRRRREAMVYFESGRPISREDIIERDPVEDIADEEVEEELEQLREEVAEAEAASEGSWLSWLSRLRPDGFVSAPAPANEW